MSTVAAAAPAAAEAPPPTGWRFDPAPLGWVALGVPLACAATLAATGFHPAPARVLAAAFLGALVPFLLFEMRRSGLAAPAVLFVVGLAYYHILIPVEYLIDPELPRSILNELPHMTEPDLVKPLVASNLALLAFIVGYCLRRDRSAPVAVRPRELDLRRLQLAAGALVAVGVALYLTMSVLGTGSITGIFHTTYEERDQLFYGMGSLGFGIDLVYVGVTVLAVTWIARGGRTEALLAVGLCAAMGLHSFLVGSKMHVFHVGLGALAGIRATNTRIKPVVVAALIVILLVPLAFVGLARNKQGQGLGAMAEFVEEEADGDAFNPANIDAWGPYLTLVHTCQTMRVPDDLKWGATYLQAITLLPPRFLYPNRPRPADEEFAEEFLGKDYYDNAGFGYSAVTEGYANGGFVGVAFAFLLAGVGLGAARDALRRRKGTLGAALIVATAAPWVALAVRDQAGGLVKGYGLMTLAPTLALLWWASRRPARPAAS